jgi:hypothetical protein
MTDTRGAVLPESIGHVVKYLLLGKPMISDQLKNERLSNPVALGVLSPDAISSSAYGTEEILIELLPYAGLAAFMLLLPITGVILLILVVVTASYRQVVMAYTRAGGSYVVARDNFGPRVAQVAAAALLIDYVVTVAVQSAAGTVAVVSAIRPLGPYSLEITFGVVLVMCYANLRGLREAGRSFAVPTYLFITVMTLMILIGVTREVISGLPTYDPQHMSGVVEIHQDSGLMMGASILVLLRAFANGGSSLTGVEAISNTVSVFRKPQGLNARRVCHRYGVHTRFPGRRGELSGLRHPFRSLCGRLSFRAFRGGTRGLRLRARRPCPLRAHSDRHGSNSLHRRQHQLQRFSSVG